MNEGSRIIFVLVAAVAIVAGVAAYVGFERSRSTATREVASAAQRQPGNTLPSPAAPHDVGGGTHAAHPPVTDEHPVPSTLRPPPAAPLSGEEQRDFDADLAAAEAAKPGKLLDDLLGQVDSGCQARTNHLAALLAWNLSKHPEGILEVLARLRRPDVKPAYVHALLLAVGGVGTKEAREALLQWLDLAALAPYQEFILEALHQAPIANRDAMVGIFQNDRRSPKGTPSPNEYSGRREANFDPAVVRVTLDRYENGGPELRAHAASLLTGLLSNPDRDAKLDPAERDAITKALLETLRSSADPAQQTWAVYGLRWVRDDAVNQALWEQLRAEPEGSPLRNTLAGAVAYQARTLEAVQRVFDAIRTETSSETRRALLHGMPMAEWRDPSMRDAGAAQIEAWARQEPDDTLRRDAVLSLGPLFPEGAAHLDWALSDLSPQVRSAAEDLMRARK